MVMVLACVRLPHELGKVPAMRFSLTPRELSCSTATKLKLVVADMQLDSTTAGAFNTRQFYSTHEKQCLQTCTL